MSGRFNICKPVFGLAMTMLFPILAACSSVGAPSNLAMVDAPSPNTVDANRSGPVPALRGAVDHLAFGAPVDAPTGYLEMCSRSPEDCQHGEAVAQQTIQVLARQEMVQRLDLLLGGSDSRRPEVATAAFSSPTGTATEATSDTVEVADARNIEGQDQAPTDGYAPMKTLRLYNNQPDNNASDSAYRPIGFISNRPADGSSVSTPQTSADWAPRPALSRPSEPAYFDMPQSLFATVRDINSRVNAALYPDSDQRMYGQSDYWVAPGMKRGTRADCEDYALEKRRLLVEAGVPAENLSVAIVKTWKGELHAVLVLFSQQGDYVLDSLTFNVVAWSKVDYTWVSIQAPGSDLKWVSISKDRKPSRSIPAPYQYAYNN